MLDQISSIQVNSLRNTGPFTRVFFGVTLDDESEHVVSVQAERQPGESAVAFANRMLTEEAAQIESQIEESNVEAMDPVEMTAALLLAGDALEDWVQPQPGVTPAYQEGEFTKHVGKVWVSLIPDNVWEPGAVGSETLWDDVMDIPTT